MEEKKPIGRKKFLCCSKDGAVGETDLLLARLRVRLSVSLCFLLFCQLLYVISIAFPETLP